MTYLLFCWYCRRGQFSKSYPPEGQEEDNDVPEKAKEDGPESGRTLHAFDSKGSWLSDDEDPLGSSDDEDILASDDHDVEAGLIHPRSMSEMAQGE